MSKKKLNKKHPAKNIGDVTINDFANSVTCKNRLKKSNNNVTTIIKQLETVKAWDDNEDFEEDFDLVREENEDGIISVVLKKATRRRNRSIQEQCNETENGNSYPIDVWFLISEYIVPEDVGRFAGICRASLDVIHSAKFWFSLYKRFYQSVTTLPERLQPECLLRRYGIRTSVIRSLYYMYLPFTNRLKFVSTLQHPDELRKRVCVLMWHEKQKSNWFYYFKFKHVSDNRLTRLKTESKQPDLLEMLDDVCANPDENCRILQVCCLHYVAFPPVLGQTLASVSLTLSQGFRHHRLLLGFGSGVYACSKNGLNNSSLNTVVLDPVVNYKVLNWWHPLYPHDHNITHLMNEEEK